MFGKNEIVGQKYFQDAGDKILVTSMFQTLQGEGPLRGEPAFFIRFSKCNLNCSFCDTYFDSGDWLTTDEIEMRIDRTIEEHFRGGIPLWATHNSEKKKDQALVITGGEPMLQKNIGPFLERMNEIFKKTQIESNGIVYQEIPDSTILVISPKCSEKTEKYLTPNLKLLERADCLKFVISGDKNSPYYTIPDWAFDWKEQTNRTIFISPMNEYNSEPQKSKQIRSEKDNITFEERSTIDEVISFWEDGLLNKDANKRNHEYSASYCVQHGLTLSLQIHLYASVA